jgi:ferredoxin-NADP reductase
VTDASHPGRLQWQNAQVVQIERRTRSIVSFFLRPQQPFAFTAGQHVDVRLTAPDGYQAQRSYSIASPPERGERIELAIERLDEGEVSPFFHDVVELGDDIELRGPIGGHFNWSAGDGPALLVGGGSGVVPLACMVRHRFAARSSAPMALVYSARAAEDLIFRDELQRFAERNDGFAFLPTLTREPDPLVPLRRGRIDAGLLEQALSMLPPGAQTVYVCGSNPFVEHASTLLLELGVVRSAIRTERYGG